MKTARFSLCLTLLTQLVSTAICQESRSGSSSSLITVAEASDYQETATYEQVMAFCRQLAAESEIVHLTSFGTTVEGRTLPLLVIADPPVDNPQALADSGKLPVFVMANIHAGEVCGKEATLMLARELARGNHRDWLKELTLLIAPIYNADGNERFSKDNRPGQRGPAAGMGQRRNLQDLDLNRDCVKLESPEARSLAQLITDWDPAILIDTHTTNGSYHRYALTYDGPRHPATPGEITAFTRDRFLPAVDEHMLQKSGYESFFYGNFDGPHQQWATYPDWPRYAIHYFGLRGRIGILSEAYAYASYRDRVLATLQFVESCCTIAAAQADAVRRVLQSARAQSKQFAVRSEPVPLDQPVDILGYVETRDERGRRVATDTPQTYAGVRYLGLSQPTLSVDAPYGYVIPAELDNVIENLRHHGVAFEVLDADYDAETESYVIKDINRARGKFEGHRLVTLEVDRESGRRRLRSGDVLVKLAQPSAALIANLLEPESQDGLATWNFFDEELAEGKTFPVLRLMQPID